MSEPKIEHLPGTKLTPKVLLARLLEQAEQIDEIAIVYTRDGMVQSTWSQMNTVQFIGLATLLQSNAIRSAEAPLDAIDVVDA